EGARSWECFVRPNGDRPIWDGSAAEPPTRRASRRWDAGCFVRQAMTRVLIILAIVLVLFAAVLIGAGLRDDSDASCSDQHWYTDALETLFGDKEPLRSKDISAPCFSAGGFRILGGSVCSATVRPADTRIRSFRLKLASGIRVTTLLQPAGKHSVSLKVPL